MDTTAGIKRRERQESRREHKTYFVVKMAADTQIALFHLLFEDFAPFAFKKIADEIDKVK